jgi:hypothetical protein
MPSSLEHDGREVMHTSNLDCSSSGRAVVLESRTTSHHHSRPSNQEISTLHASPENHAQMERNGQESFNTNRSQQLARTNAMTQTGDVPYPLRISGAFHSDALAQSNHRRPSAHGPTATMHGYEQVRYNICPVHGSHAVYPGTTGSFVGNSMPHSTAPLRLCPPNLQQRPLPLMLAQQHPSPVSNHVPQQPTNHCFEQCPEQSPPPLPPSTDTTAALNGETPNEGAAAKRPWRCLALVGCLVLLIVILAAAIGVLVSERYSPRVVHALRQDSSDALHNNTSIAPIATAPTENVTTPMVSVLDVPVASPMARAIDAVANVQLDLVGATVLLNRDSIAILAKGCHQFITKKFDLSGGDIVECQLVTQQLVERERPGRQRRLQGTRWTLTMMTALRIQLHITVECASESYSDSFTETKLHEMLQYMINAKSLLTFWTKSGDQAFAPIEMVVLSDHQVASQDSSTAPTVSPAAGAWLATTVPPN